MARKDKPYLPLYVQDFLTDERLLECSASANGIYIRIMCFLHKSETYGKILLKQNDKQTESKVENFAYKLSKFLPYQTKEILSGLNELLEAGCLKIEENYIIQKRMVSDASLSETRAKVGKKGGKISQKNTHVKTKNFAKANCEANADIENDIENDIDYCFKSESFLKKWGNWKIHREKEIKKPFKTAQSEQAALHHLFKISSGNESDAIEIIEISIANQYQGLFELKKQQNVSVKNINGAASRGIKNDSAYEFLKKISGDQ